MKTLKNLFSKFGKRFNPFKKSNKRRSKRRNSNRRYSKNNKKGMRGGWGGNAPTFTPPVVAPTLN